MLDKAGQVIGRLSQNEIKDFVENGSISEGMIPKVNCALSAIENGVSSVQIIDGRIPNALLLELFTDSGIGTQIIDHKKTSA